MMILISAGTILFWWRMTRSANFQERRRLERHLADLSAMEDRELQDLGIGRSELEALVLPVQGPRVMGYWGRHMAASFDTVTKPLTVDHEMMAQANTSQPKPHAT